MNKTYLRGDMYYADLGRGIGSEQEGYTIEGNSGDSCRQNSYPVGYYEIYGYGTPAY